MQCLEKCGEGQAMYFTWCWSGPHHTFSSTNACDIIESRTSTSKKNSQLIGSQKNGWWAQPYKLGTREMQWGTNYHTMTLGQVRNRYLQCIQCCAQVINCLFPENIACQLAARRVYQLIASCDPYPIHGLIFFLLFYLGCMTIYRGMKRGPYIHIK